MKAFSPQRSSGRRMAGKVPEFCKVTYPPRGRPFGGGGVHRSSGEWQAISSPHRNNPVFKRKIYSGRTFFFVLLTIEPSHFPRRRASERFSGRCAVKHHERDMAALHHPGGDDIEDIMGSGPKAALAHDPEQLLRGKGPVTFCVRCTFSGLCHRCH